MNKILLINDMAGYGKVALSVMIPILSNMKFQVYNLPTALVSNTLDYGKFDIMETTSYMKNSIEVWNELGFSFDAISTGFLVSEEQTKLVAQYCKEKKAGGAKVFVDPIMGDNGKLYNGVTESTVEYMRQMCSVADIIMPNFTEASFLADVYEGRTQLSASEAEVLMDKMKELAAGSVVITSVNIDGKMYTMTYDHVNGTTENIGYEEIPVRFPGTGDIFSAILIGSYLRGEGLTQSTGKAMTTVAKLIELNKDNVDKDKGIPIEQWLGELQ